MKIRVSSSSFFKYLSAQSTTRVAKVREAKKMMESPHEDYAAIDYWIGLREATIRFLTGSMTKDAYKKSIAKVSDSKKVTNYSSAAEGIQKWLGRKDLTASTINSANWKESGLKVSVTPEIKLSWKDSPTYIVKLYFSADPISKYIANPMLRLLEHTHGPLGIAAILDAQRGKLHFGPTVRPNDLDILLKTEAAGFVSIWNSI
jgi:hypothetical protein